MCHSNRLNACYLIVKNIQDKRRRIVVVLVAHLQRQRMLLVGIMRRAKQKQKMKTATTLAPLPTVRAPCDDVCEHGKRGNYSRDEHV